MLDISPHDDGPTLGSGRYGLILTEDKDSSSCRTSTSLEPVDLELDVEESLDPWDNEITKLSSRRISIRVPNRLPLSTMVRILNENSVGDIEVADR